MRALGPGLGCSTRRDTRGERGYDGAGGAGMTELILRGWNGGRAGGLVLDRAGYPRRGAGMTDLARAGVTDLILHGGGGGAPLDVWAGALLCGWVPACAGVTDGAQKWWRGGVRGLGAGQGGIPAAGRGYDGSCSRGCGGGRARGLVLDTAGYPRRGAGMTDLARAGVGRCCAGVGGGGGAWVLDTARYPRQARV